METGMLCRQIALNLHSHLTVLIFSYSDLLQFHGTYYFPFDLKISVHSFFLCLIALPQCHPLMGSYLPFKAKPKCYFVRESILDKPHYIQCNMLFVFFLELNTLAVPINGLSWECLS